MSNDKLSLAERREALIVQCSIQRRDAARELSALMTPLKREGGGGIGKLFGGGAIKLPLTIASTVIGMIAAKSGRVLPALAVGMSLFKVARSVLAVVRK